MKARSLRLAGKPIDIAFDPMQSLSAAGAATEAQAEVPEANKDPGEANGAAHPAAAKPRPAKSQREQRVNGHPATAENGGRAAAELPGLRAELARARAQIASLEASEKRLGAELSQIRDSQSAQTRSLERSLAVLGDELGNVLAERSAAELRAEAAAEKLARLTAEHERAQTAADELRTALDRQLAEWGTEREQLARARDGLRQELANTTAQLAQTSNGRERLRAEAIELRTSLDAHLAEWGAEREQLSAETAELRALLDRRLGEWRNGHAALAAERDTLAADLADVRQAMAFTQAHAAEVEERARAAASREVALGRELFRTATDLAKALAQCAALRLGQEAANHKLAEMSQGRATGTHDGELIEQLRRRAQMLLPPGEPVASDPIEIMQQVRRRVRGLEAQLDKLEAQHERAQVTPAYRLRVHSWLQKLHRSRRGLVL